MKKALFISSRELFPIIGGEKIRTAQQLELLSKLYIVDVICISENSKYNLGPLKKYINEYFHFYTPKWKNIINTLFFLFNKKPLQVNYYYSNKIQKFINENINKYDLVFCNNLRTVDYILNKKIKPIKCIDYVDAISMNYERAKARSKGLKKLIYSIDYYRCNKYEQEILLDFDHHYIISDVDAQYILRNFPNKHITIINNAVEFIKESNLCNHNTQGVITFVGKMSYDPNIIAVTNFAQNIMPRIWSTKPNTIFQIVGANPTKAVKNLTTINPKIHVTGFVEDVNKYMCSSTIIVAPMITGAGVQNKILQAMSLGCCVVTTSIGAEGLNCTNEEICIEDNNEKLANKIIALLDNKEQRVEYGRKAYNYIKEHLTKDIIFEILKEDLTKK